MAEAEASTSHPVIRVSEAEDGLLQPPSPSMDEIDAAVVKQPFKRHSNAFRRKSSISARLSSHWRKYSFSRPKSSGQDSTEDQVVLRKDL